MKASSVSIGLAAAFSSFGVPIMMENPFIGYIVVIIGAVVGFIVGNLFEEVLEKEYESRRTFHNS